MNIHYFQRYHDKENVETANLMLLLSRFYHYNSYKFYSFMNDLLNEDIEELKFDLQSVNPKSVPDAIISQKSFKIIIETKLYNQFNTNQLINHIASFNNEDIKILLTINPIEMKEDVKEEFDAYLQEENKKSKGTPIIHINTTFETIFNSIEKHIDSRDYEMLDVLEDYKQYCIDEGLVDKSGDWMRGITARTTYDSNIKNSLYYDGFYKGFSKHGYIGLYKDKSIRAIGKIKKIVTRCKDKNGMFQIKIEQGGKILTDDEKKDIENAIEDSKLYYGNALNTYDHRFFLVDKFYEIDYHKTQGGPIQRAKFFDLASIMGVEKLPEDTQEIAKFLDGKTWEETL